MRVLVIGSDHRVADQLAQLDRAAFDRVIGVNAAAKAFGPVDVHATLHPEMYAADKQAYMVAHERTDACPQVDEVFNYLWHGCNKSGSSGLFAVGYALKVLQAREVVLAGVGMDVAPHFNRERKWRDAEIFRQVWPLSMQHLRGRVTSMGGWTAELLGRPSPAVLKEAEHGVC